MVIITILCKMHEVGGACGVLKVDEGFVVQLLVLDTYEVWSCVTRELTQR